MYIVFFQELRQPGNPADTILYINEKAFVEHDHAIQYVLNEISCRRNATSVARNYHHGLRPDYREELQVFANDGVWRSFFIVPAYVQQSSPQARPVVRGRRVYVVVQVAQAAKITDWGNSAWVLAVSVDPHNGLQEWQRQSAVVQALTGVAPTIPRVVLLELR